jgi:hypothetical protein
MADEEIRRKVILSSQILERVDDDRSQASLFSYVS